MNSEAGMKAIIADTSCLIIYDKTNFRISESIKEKVLKKAGEW